MPASGDWLPFEQARLVVVSQNFKRSQDFKDWSARPENIPYSPQKAYQQEWVGWSHFLGIGPRLDASRKDRTQFLSFDEARLVVVSQNFKRSHPHTAIRTRWYSSPHGQTYRTYALADNIDCDLPLEPSVIAAAMPYPLDAKPVFVGHYWLSGSQPELLADNVGCVDYSVAKDGFLCAYRWHGEQKLNNSNFVWAGKAQS